MIKFDAVSKDFGIGEAPALCEVSFAVKPGEFVFITGHSGCGKTTLLRLLLREFHPTSGTIYFKNDDLSRLSGRKIAKHRQKVGVIFQDYQLLEDLTVWENIALPLTIAKFPRQEIHERINELLAVLGLTELAEVFPQQLSGGEAQRIGVARALAIAPEVIFADEPTGNLDAANAAAIVALLRKVNEYGTTVLFATHNLDLLPHVNAARQLEFANGKLIKDTGCPLVESEPTPVDPTDSDPPPTPKAKSKPTKERIKT